MSDLDFDYDEEQRRLEIEEKKLLLDERRLQLEQRRASFVNVVTEKTATEKSTTPKVLSAEELKVKKKEVEKQKIAPSIGKFLVKLIPVVEEQEQIFGDEQSREKVCNDANAMRAQEIVKDMEHPTMRKRKLPENQDTGKEGKGVRNGKKIKSSTGELCKIVFIYVYIYIYICVCVCVYIYVYTFIQLFVRKYF